MNDIDPIQITVTMRSGQKDTFNAEYLGEKMGGYASAPHQIKLTRDVVSEIREQLENNRVLVFTMYPENSDEYDRSERGFPIENVSTVQISRSDIEQGVYKYESPPLIVSLTLNPELAAEPIEIIRPTQEGAHSPCSADDIKGRLDGEWIAISNDQEGVITRFSDIQHMTIGYSKSPNSLR